MAAAIESLGEAEKRAQHHDRMTRCLVEILVAVVIGLWCRATMVPGDERDDVDLFRFEAAEVAVLDQVIRVAVVTLIADVVADVVKQRRVFEPLTPPSAGPVN